MILLKVVKLHHPISNKKEQYKKYLELYHPRSDQLLIHFEQGELAESVYIGIQSAENLVNYRKFMMKKIDA